MPPVTILSPYSGRPVVVREQDLGRAIRDDQGKVFYVVEDAEHGRYASMTRKGSPKDLERYRALQDGKAPAPAGDNAAAALTNTAAGQAAAYDATGVKRRNPVGIVMMLIALAVVAAGAYVVVTHPEWIGLEQATPTDSQTAPGNQDDESTGDRGALRQARPDHPVAASLRYASSKQAPPTDEGVQRPRDESVAEDEGAPAAGDDPPRDAGWKDESVSQQDTEQQAQPRLTAEPAVLPATGEEFVDRLAEADDAASDEPEADPAPVIVPTRTWRPGESQPAVLGARDHDDKPYAGFSHTASGLRYKFTHRTDGPPAKAGCVLEVRYTAQTLEGETLIDDGEQTFVLMAGQAIRAFDEGLAGVREGEQIKLFIPRGHSEDGALPGVRRVPDQPFMMDVQLVKVRPGVTHVVERPGDAEAEPAMPGDTLAIHYLARVEGRDEVIATTVQDGEPLRLTLGQGAVIPGLELGLTGMRPGETRLLSVPPYLGYGADGAAGGLIPPNAVLSFRVTLVRIEPDEGDADAHPDERE
jgi:peptidylprolyl isomerase